MGKLQEAKIMLKYSKLLRNSFYIGLIYLGIGLFLFLLSLIIGGPLFESIFGLYIGPAYYLSSFLINKIFISKSYQSFITIYFIMNLILTFIIGFIIGLIFNIIKKLINRNN